MTFLLLILSSFTSVSFAAPLSPRSGAITFTALASPGALKINGKGTQPEGRLELNEVNGKFEASGQLKLKMDTLTTGLSLRDSHMKDKYLETGKFPEAMLILSKQSLPKTGSGPFEGDLILHGIKHKVSGTAEAKLEGGVASIKAGFPVKLEDHGITIPTFAGVSVANEVAIETEFQAEAKAN